MTENACRAAGNFLVGEAWSTQLTAATLHLLVVKTTTIDPAATKDGNVSTLAGNDLLAGTARFYLLPFLWTSIAMLVCGVGVRACVAGTCSL